MREGERYALTNLSLGVFIMQTNEFKVMAYVKQVMQELSLVECERIVNYLGTYVNQRARAELDVLVEDDEVDE